MSAAADTVADDETAAEAEETTPDADATDAVEGAVTPEQLSALKRELAGWVEESRVHAEPFGPETLDGRPRFDLGAEHGVVHDARLFTPDDQQHRRHQHHIQEKNRHRRRIVHAEYFKTRSIEIIGHGLGGGTRPSTRQHGHGIIESNTINGSQNEHE